jgi:hypothetical protein
MIRHQANSATTLDVSDVSGKNHLHVEGLPRETELDLSHLPAGVYFLRFSNADGVRFKRIVVH